MLGAALNSAAETEIVAIDRFRFAELPLLHQQRRQSVSRRMHPGPRLDIFEVVIEANAVPKMGEPSPSLGASRPPTLLNRARHRGIIEPFCLISNQNRSNPRAKALQVGKLYKKHSKRLGIAGERQRPGIDPIGIDIRDQLEDGRSRSRIVSADKNAGSLATNASRRRVKHFRERRNGLDDFCPDDSLPARGQREGRQHRGTELDQRCGN